MHRGAKRFCENICSLTSGKDMFNVITVDFMNVIMMAVNVLGTRMVNIIFDMFQSQVRVSFDEK